MQSNAALPMDPVGQATVALAGPLGNFLLLGFCLAASRWMIYDVHMLRLMVDINLLLALVNLLPALPLDGGHALRGYLAGSHGPRHATSIALRFTALGAWMSSALFAVGLLRGDLWPWPAVLALLFWQQVRGMRGESSWQGMRQMLSRRRIMNKRKWHEVKRVSVLEDCTVTEVMTLLGASRYYHFEVTDAAGKVLGSLSEGSLMEAFFAGLGHEPVGKLLR